MKDFIETLIAWDGAVRGDSLHKQIVNAYNSYLPHPRGYALTTEDDYCAATVSAAAILCGLADVIPIECSCGEQMRQYQARGLWVEADDHVPEVGDQIFYHWGDGKNYAKTNCTGAPNHTGIVTRVVGRRLTVFEGNMGSAHRCGYRTLEVNGRYIRGYGMPTYPTEKRALKKGDAGKEVERLQQLLVSCGWGVSVDGSFGPATQKAWGEYVAAWITETTKK